MLTARGMRQNSLSHVLSELHNFVFELVCSQDVHIY